MDSGGHTYVTDFDEIFVCCSSAGCQMLGWTGYIIARVARLKGDPWENDVFPKAN